MVKIWRVIYIKLNQLYFTVLLRKWCHNNKHFPEHAQYHGGKQLA